MAKKTDRAQTRQQRKIGYARVSTEDQNLHLQLDALRAAGCTMIHRDNGVSGVAASRPGLKKVLAALREGDTLVIWKLDRLGRSLADLIAIMATLEQRHIGFCSLSESIDTTTPGGRLVFHVMGALAEFERGLISERTKAGMAAAKARGARIGRPRKLTPAQIARAHRRLAAKKADLAELAEEYGVTPLTLRRAVKPRSGS